MYKPKDCTSLPYTFNTSTDELFYRQLREISGFFLSLWETSGSQTFTGNTILMLEATLGNS